MGGCDQSNLYQLPAVMPVARGNMTSSSVLRAAPRLARVPHRSFLSLFGSQAPEFLNGVLATSIREPRRPGFSTVLNAQVHLSSVLA